MNMTEQHSTPMPMALSEVTSQVFRFADMPFADALSRGSFFMVLNPDLQDKDTTTLEIIHLGSGETTVQFKDLKVLCHHTTLSIEKYG